MASAIAQLIIGLASLFFGRRIFWLFIALAGFMVGLLLGQQFFSGQPELARFLLAVIIGAVLAALALIIQRPIVAIGGFFALGTFGLLLATLLSVDSSLRWVFFLAGGIIGAILVFMLFDWALIINSAFSGASATVAGLGLFVPEIGGWIASLLLVVLAAAGIAFQARDLRGQPGADVV